MTDDCFERGVTYTFLPEARPVIDVLRRRGQRIEAARLAAFKPELPNHLALATLLPDGTAVDDLATALADELSGNPAAKELARWALVRRCEAGYIVAFPKVIAVPIRVRG